jgi:uncharacterized membrane protein YdjX (TVP38/TMEM64 family)
MKRALKVSAILVILAALLIAARLLPVKSELPVFLEWIRGLGLMGGLLFGLVYALGTILFFPGSLLTLASGFLFGPIWGTVIASPASVLGATGAFLLGRTAARNWIAGKVASSPKFAALQGAIGKEGLKILMLVRLSPVFPFSLVNYAFGLTGIRLRDYALGSWIAMLPGTFLYVYLGSLITDAAALASGAKPPAAGSTAQRVMLWAGLIATLAVVVLVTRTARRALARAVPELEKAEK